MIIRVPKRNTTSLGELFFAFSVLLLSYTVINANGLSNTVNRAIMATILLVFVSVLFYAQAVYKRMCTRSGLMLILFLLYILAFSTLEYGVSTTVGAILSQLTYFSGFLIIFVCMERIESGFIKRLLFFGTIFIWLYGNVKLIILCHAFPNIGREIASHTADFTLVSYIGSPYGIAESTCLISIVLYRFTIDRQCNIGLLSRIVFLALLGVFSYAVYLTQSTITTLILIGGIGSETIGKVIQSSKSKKKKQMMLVFIILLILILITKNQIGNYLINTFGRANSVFEIRMQELGHLLSGSSVSSDIVARRELFIQSWMTIWKHPLFGNLYNGGSISGQHSHLVDIISDYGFAGAIPYMLIPFFEICYLRKKLSNYDLAAWLPIVVMSFLNPLRMYQVYFAFFFLIPFIYHYFDLSVNCRKTK